MDPKTLDVSVEPVTNEEDQLIKRCVLGWKGQFVRAEGFIQPPGYAAAAQALRSVKVREDDIWVVTYPRSGTTWTQELVWLLKNDLDYEAAKAQPLATRFPMLEVTTHIPEIGRKMIHMGINPTGVLGEIQGVERAAKVDSWKALQEAPSPRLIKTHLPLPLLPPEVLKKAKVVYVARDPRDVAVSYYYMHKMASLHLTSISLKDYCNIFFRDLLPSSPHWKHVASAWKHKGHPNLLLLRYEEMSKDLPEVVKRVARFLKVDVTENQIEDLCVHLHIDSFRQNRSINTPVPNGTSGCNRKDEKLKNSQFVRKGKVGGWEESFDEKTKQKAQEYLAAHRYPPED